MQAVAAGLLPDIEHEIESQLRIQSRFVDEFAADILVRNMLDLQFSLYFAFISVVQSEGYVDNIPLFEVPVIDWCETGTVKGKIIDQDFVFFKIPFVDNPSV